MRTALHGQWSPGDTSKCVSRPDSAATASSIVAWLSINNFLNASAEIGSPLLPAVILSRILVMCGLSKHHQCGKVKTHVNRYKC